MNGVEDHRGPIYDTINDDSSGSGYSRSHSGGGGGSDHGGYAPQSTFSPNNGAAGLGGGYPKANPGYSHDYDIPEGSDHGSSSRSGSGSGPNAAANGNSVGAVTINGIAV